MMPVIGVKMRREKRRRRKSRKRVAGIAKKLRKTVPGNFEGWRLFFNICFEFFCVKMFV